MEFLETAFVIISLSFGTVAGAFVGICVLCWAFGREGDGKREIEEAKAREVSIANGNYKSHERVSHGEPNYIGIFATLLVLTIVTVILSRINLGGPTNTTLAVLVASVKASLVALYFMHLKFEKRLIFSLIFIPLFFFVALVVGLLPDLVTNNYNEDNSERPGFGEGHDSSK